MKELALVLCFGAPAVHLMMLLVRDILLENERRIMRRKYAEFYAEMERRRQNAELTVETRAFSATGVSELLQFASGPLVESEREARERLSRTSLPVWSVMVAMALISPVVQSR